MKIPVDETLRSTKDTKNQSRIPVLGLKIKGELKVIFYYVGITYHTEPKRDGTGDAYSGLLKSELSHTFIQL